MKVLVTGADGFVGQHLVRALLDRDHDVVGGISGAEPDLRTLPRSHARRVVWHPFDLRDPASVRQLVNGAAPDAVVHLAGVASVSRAWREPEHTFQVNATGALHLLLAIRALPAPAEPRAVLLIGSGEAYGRDGTEDAPLRELDPLLPINPYGASKAAQEMLGFAFGRTDHIRLVQTRSFQQIGPGQRPDFVTIDWALQLLRIRAGGTPPVLDVGNLQVTRDFLDVRDAAEAYITLLERRTQHALYNVCSGRACSLHQLLQALQDATGVQVRLRVDPDKLRPVDIGSFVGDPARLMNDTGWRPHRTLQQTLRDVLAFLKHSQALA